MIRRPRALLLLMLAASPGSASAQNAPATASPRAVVERGLAAMGGAEAARGVRSLGVEFATVVYQLGQEVRPGARPPFFLRTGTQVWDYAGRRMAIEAQTWRPLPSRQRFVTTTAAGMAVTDGAQAPQPAMPAAGSRALRQTPLQLLTNALASDASLRSMTRAGGQAGVRVATPHDTLTLWFDRAGGELAAIEETTDDPILGDRLTRTEFLRWRPVGDGPLRLPSRVDVLVNGVLQASTGHDRWTVNPALPDSLFAIPDSIAARSPRLDARGDAPVAVRLDSVAPGVWHVTGGSHHSLAVVQGDSIVLVEAPLSSARMEAVLDTLRARFPRSPVRLAVNSHLHWDHASGVRAALAAGLTVLTHRANVEPLRRVAARPRTLRPDGVERRAGVARQIRAVGDSLVAGRGATRLTVHHIPTPHTDGMLGVYLPEHRILFTSDVAPTRNRWDAADMVRWAERRGLVVERIVGGHGAPTPWAEMVAAAAGQAAAR